MKEMILRRYKCDGCGTIFDTEAKCLEHEQQHFYPIAMCDVNFFNCDEYSESSLKYPDSIKIKFKDKYITYRITSSEQEEFEI